VYNTNVRKISPNSLSIVIIHYENFNAESSSNYLKKSNAKKRVINARFWRSPIVIDVSSLEMRAFAAAVFCESPIAISTFAIEWWSSSQREWEKMRCRKIYAIHNTLWIDIAGRLITAVIRGSKCRITICSRRCFLPTALLPRATERIKSRTVIWKPTDSASSSTCTIRGAEGTLDEERMLGVPWGAPIKAKLFVVIEKWNFSSGIFPVLFGFQGRLN